MKIGDTIPVFDRLGPAPRDLIGHGVIEEIVSLKGYDGPVACIRIPGLPGRYLRECNYIKS